MNTNNLADTIQNYLITKCARVHRNRPLKSPIPIYIIYRLDSVADTYPSYDYVLQIDIFDKNDVTANAIESMADSIQADLDHSVINNAVFNAQVELSGRQYIGVTDLVEAQLVRLTYDLRVYYK